MDLALNNRQSLLCHKTQTINQSLNLRFPTLRTIGSILMEKLSLSFLHLFKYLWDEDAHVEVFFNFDVKGSDCPSYIKILAF